MSACRRSSPAVAGPPWQGYSVILPLSPLPGFPLSQYEIDTSRFAAEGHDRPALSPCHLLYTTPGKMKKTLPHNDAPRSGIKIAFYSLTSKRDATVQNTSIAGGSSQEGVRAWKLSCIGRWKNIRGCRSCTPASVRAAQPARPTLSTRRDHSPWIFFSCSNRGGDGHLDALAPHMSWSLIARVYTPPRM